MFFRNQDCTDISELSNTSENDEQNAKALVWSLSILQWFLLIPNGNLKEWVKYKMLTIPILAIFQFTMRIGHLIKTFFNYLDSDIICFSQ